jgi:hypothetical protein
MASVVPRSDHRARMGRPEPPPPHHLPWPRRALGRGGGPANRAVKAQAPGSVGGHFKVTSDDLAEKLAEPPHIAPQRGRDRLASIFPGPGGPVGRHVFGAGLANCAYSNESTSASSEASMMLLEQPTVVQRLRPFPDSMSTRVVALVPAAPSRIRTL